MRKLRTSDTLANSRQLSVSSGSWFLYHSFARGDPPKLAVVSHIYSQKFPYSTVGFGAPNVGRTITYSYCACHLMPTVVSLFRADPMISIYYFFASGPPTPSRMPGYCRGVVPSRPDAPNRCFSKGFQLKSKLFQSPAAPEPPRRSKPLFF